MCGLTGFWASHGADKAVGQRMAEQIHARGPDESGVWADENAGIVLAHRRLAVVDLSSAGSQPMQSPCQRFVLSFNGEIYNHIDIRSILEADLGRIAWRGHSDTETLLAALRHWGVQGGAIQICVGDGFIRSGRGSTRCDLSIRCPRRSSEGC